MGILVSRTPKNAGPRSAFKNLKLSVFFLLAFMTIASSSHVQSKKEFGCLISPEGAGCGGGVYHPLELVLPLDISSSQSV